MGEVSALGSLRYQFSGQVVAPEHFGINLVFRYEAIGDLPWQNFDEVHAAVGAASIRYPGGRVTEDLFDIRDPHAAGEGDASLVPMAAFLDHCRATDSRAMIVLPTAWFLTEEEAYGQRGFDEDRAPELGAFLSELLESAPGIVSLIELGNEYQTFMTSEEYGRVATRMAEITQQAIERHFATRDGAHHPAEPQIAVQAWTQDPSGTLSLEQLQRRNDAVIAEFEQAGLDAIDMVTTHYYFLRDRFPGTELHQTLASLDTALAATQPMFRAWEAATGRELDQLYSEWNVSLQAEETIGLRQWPYLLELFSALVETGVDQAAFWSVLHHPTSLGVRDGSLTPAGELFAYLRETVVGMYPVEIEQTLPGFHLTGFLDGEGARLFASSTSAATVQFRPGQDVLPGYVPVGGHLVGVDPATVDGRFEHLSGLAPWQEPDVETTFTWIDGDRLAGPDARAVALSPYETFILYLEPVAGTAGDTPVIHGTAGDDFIFDTPRTRAIFAGDGDDTIQVEGPRERTPDDQGAATGQLHAAVADASGTIGDRLSEAEAAARPPGIITILLAEIWDF